MNRLRSAAGFTLIELVMVLAIIGVVTAFALPSVTRYRNQEEAREGVSRIAAQLRDARSQAMKQGIPHAVFFWPNGAGPGQPVIMRILRDNNGNFQRDPGEVTRDVNLRDLGLGQNASVVTAYNSAAGPPPHPAGSRAPDDLGVGPLATVPAGGASFPLDVNLGPPSPHTVFTGLNAVGFTTRGLPVPVNDFASIAEGAGAFYVTDNQFAVYAVTVGGLGEIRVRTYVPGSDTWR